MKEAAYAASFIYGGLPTQSFLFVVVHLLYINFALFCFAQQVLAEEVRHLPEEIFVLGLKAVSVTGENQSIG